MDNICELVYLIYSLDNVRLKSTSHVCLCERSTLKDADLECEKALDVCRPAPTYIHGGMEWINLYSLWME